MAEAAKLALMRVIRKGALVCLFSSSTGEGALLELSGNENAGAVNAAFQALKWETPPKNISAKVLAPKACLELICAALAAAGVVVVSKVPLVGDETSIYFYPETGRVRMSVPRRTRVLIVDDSKTMRSLLSKMISKSPELEVVGDVEDPREALKAIERLRPDVMTLDIHMPAMDGCAVLRQVMPLHSLPTVMVSSIGIEEGNQVLQALELGAVDYMQKPAFNELDAAAETIIEKIKTAASAKIRKRSAVVRRVRRDVGAGSATGTIVAIGSSTGGTEALREVLIQLPKDIPPILVVQHIPPVFSKAFAQRLNSLCPFEVKEAENGDSIKPGRVLIAPGGMQMCVERGSGGMRVRVFDGPPVNRHKPSVDVMFDSVAELYRAKAIGVILTGMGADGAKGLLRMRQAGARTIAQDEASCAVFGMPKEAINLGAAEVVCDLDKIPEVLLSWLGSARSATA